MVFSVMREVNCIQLPTLSQEIPGDLVVGFGEFGVGRELSRDMVP